MQLAIGPKIGDGQFGDVCEGTLTRPGRQPTEVAIKSLKEVRWALADDIGAHLHQDVDPLNRRLFREEALLMKDFKHPFIVTLFGICSVRVDGDLVALTRHQDMPALIVMELMSGGELRKYLIKNADRLRQSPYVYIDRRYSSNWWSGSASSTAGKCPRL